MPRRAPIEDPPSGVHRPENVAGRLTDDALSAAVTRLKNLEPHMPATWDETLARLDNIVAAATTVRQSVPDHVVAAVTERLDALETALELAPAANPNVDPNAPVDPNQPV